MNEIDNNWRNGNLKKILIRNNFCLRGLDYFNGAIGYEHIAISDTLWHWDREKMLAFLHRSRLTVESWITVPRGSSAVTNTEIVVVWDTKKIEIRDIKCRLICELQELDEDERVSWNLVSCCISGDQMAVISRNEKEEN